MIEVLRALWKDAPMAPVSFVDHHLPHIVYAYRNSEFERVVGALIDGRAITRTGGST